MKARLSILFLSSLALFESGCGSTKLISKTQPCENRKFQDSLIVRYVDSGAEKLPYYYNNPAWGSYMDSILSICPRIAAAYQLKAVPAIKNGEYIKAYKLDEEASELDSPQFVSYLGFLKCIFTKDYPGAIIDFNRANRIIPGGAEMDHSFYFYLGLCYLELEKYQEADSNFRKDIFYQNRGDSLMDVHFNSLLYMGITKLELNQSDSAEIYLRKCLHIYTKLPEANYYLALVCKRRNELDLEKKYLEMAQKSLLEGYSMNEGNLYYVNYPKQITLYEINRQLSSIHQSLFLWKYF
jgi:tetratricopeptide (TPR) repeat protein